MREIECPACGEMIPSDSRYCDMCGAELLECINCHTIGTDPFCPECGKPMIARRPDNTVSKTDNTVSKVVEDTGKTIGKRERPLVLKSCKGNIILRPENEAVIGRTEGPYASQLSALSLISRRHGKFVRQSRGWAIVDFGSTNGTYVNDREVPPDSPVLFKVGDQVDIGTYVFEVVEE